MTQKSLIIFQHIQMLSISNSFLVTGWWLDVINFCWKTSGKQIVPLSFCFHSSLFHLLPATFSQPSTTKRRTSTQTPSPMSRLKAWFCVSHLAETPHTKTHWLTLLLFFNLPSHFYYSIYLFLPLSVFSLRVPVFPHFHSVKTALLCLWLADIFTLTNFSPHA